MLPFDVDSFDLDNLVILTRITRETRSFKEMTRCDAPIASGYSKLVPSRTTRSETVAPFYAASFSFGLSPARAANRTSKSMLNRSILPRFRSDTRA